MVMVMVGCVSIHGMAMTMVMVMVMVGCVSIHGMAMTMVMVCQSIHGIGKKKIESIFLA